jgi:hypothetical protein
MTLQSSFDNLLNRKPSKPSQQPRAVQDGVRAKGGWVRAVAVENKTRPADQTEASSSKTKSETSTAE